MKLLVVESPVKSRTLKRFLGKDYKVAATMGHFRDLPQKELGIDIKHNFKPKYVIIPAKKKILAGLKKEASKASEVLLCVDPDREGEAIAWHLQEALGDGNRFSRIVFHEITKSAIEKALKNPRKIDINLVDAQQARRILDRLVGYKLSPFLWKKIVRGLSAGRVQSVAVRIIVDREREIEKFKPQEYWSISALLKKSKDKEFEAVLSKKDNKAIPKMGITTEKQAKAIVKDLKGADYKVCGIEKKRVNRNPFPPFTTSTLQQEAWKRFRFPAKFTMSISQSLYEKGLTTYHRTDSVNLSNEALAAAKALITKNYGSKYWAGAFRQFKTKSKSAQEAHEAIRPTYVGQTPDKVKSKLDEKQFKLYNLIWRRFTACQMAPAQFDSTVLEISADKYEFRASGQVMKFDGFLKVYPVKFEENNLPDLAKGDMLDLIKLLPNQHFTQPPARYTEASLIKVLEEHGIGRPSTYAPIISTIQARNYIEKNEKKRFCPTEVGVLVNDLLVKHFPEIVDINFTAEMEDDLDKIAHGKKEWEQVIKEFYKPFISNLEKKEKQVDKLVIKTKEVCEKCGKEMVIKFGRFGKFMACSGFPDCKNTKTIEKSTGVRCPTCGQGDVIERKTKKGKTFWGCNKWPECDYATWEKPGSEKEKK